jgi:diguanylate cyclase (GGDEF)-like protein/PAS domain S-box-containing protein
MLKFLQIFSHRLIWLSLLIAFGIGGLFAHAIWTLRQETWIYATRNNDNLARTVERGIGSSLDSFDRSLQGVVAGMGQPEVLALPPELRNQVLFDKSLRARGAGDVMVLDDRGNLLLDATTLTPSKTNFADRDYFQIFANGGHQGLFVGIPVISRIKNSYVLPMARAYYHPDGRFAGVVVGATPLRFFNQLFSSVDLGESSGVNFLRTDGVLISRFPYNDDSVGKSIAGTSNMQRFAASSNGSFVGTAVLDGVERLYSFRRVDGYPLIVNVAQASNNILASWERTARVLGLFAVMLMVAVVGVAALFVRELGRRQTMAGKLREAEHTLRTIMNNMPSMIAYWDQHLHNRFANQMHADWFGIDPKKLHGLHIRQLVGDVRFEQDRIHLQNALKGDPQLFERTMTDAHGTVRHVMISLLPDWYEERVQGIFSQVTDISDRKRMEGELFAEKERMRLTLQSIGDAVVCTDAHCRVTYLNPVAERLTGWSNHEAQGEHTDDVLKVQASSDPQLPLSPLATAIHQNRMVLPTRGVLTHRTSGMCFDVEESAGPITDASGSVTGAVAVLRDVTENVALVARMAHLAQYDALTDLPNRALLHDRAEQAMAQARREKKSVALLYMDLDGFKAVNDTLGHAVGDALLVEVATRLRSAVREADTVCRQGGDEFVILLPGIDGLDAVRRVADKVLAVCLQPFDIDQHTVKVGISGGIAMFPQHGVTFDELSVCADNAMYASKRAGRMRFKLYMGPGAEPAPFIATTAQLESV